MLDEQRSKLEQLGDLFGGNRIDDRTFVKMHDHEPAGFELAQRFAHRHAADIVFLRDCILNQCVAFLEFAVENALTQCLGESFRQALALDFTVRRHAMLLQWASSVGIVDCIQ